MSFEVWRARMYLFGKHAFAAPPSGQVLLGWLALTGYLVTYSQLSFWGLCWTIGIANVGLLGAANLNSERARLAFARFLLKESKKPSASKYYLLVVETLKELKKEETERSRKLLEEGTRVANKHNSSQKEGFLAKETKAQMRVRQKMEKLNKHHRRVDEQIDGLAVENRILEVETVLHDLEETERVLEEIHRDIEARAQIEAQTVDGLLEDKTGKDSPDKE